MQITFYGGAGEVGRSCFLLEDGEKNLMLDCGIKLGEKTEYPIISDGKLEEVKNIVVSHAHLDHSGYLPHIYAKGANPKVFLTKPTRDLISVLLADYQRIQKDKENNFKQIDVNNALKSANIVEYNQNTRSDFDFTFLNAGHVLGSAMIKINNCNTIYSGDICMRKTRTLDACERNISAETLIVESTYGGKNDVLPSFKDSSAKLVTSIIKTLDSGGWVIIPSFAVGRAQEILLMLDDYMRSGVLPQTKIYVEGMINKALRIYRHNAYYANDDIKKRILMSEDDPFKSKFFHKSRSKTREDVLENPCIIVTTSGMLSGGPVLYYLERLGNDPKTKIIFVGYQATGTLGRKILNGEKKVKVGENEVEIKMQVEQIRMSGHPDYNELLQFIKGVRSLKRVFLVHGEKSDLKDSLEKKYEVMIPKLGETFEF
ncbi:MAG: MBL fold metallo-hydrolase RNA specificity domain-containing protein [Candidatus Micrarchaeota archaeon]|nr:MBL fold metallo-hydrolase RNA specificity domain-containing protein [Candidatus Micrarchaeota archaeon]